MQATTYQDQAAAPPPPPFALFPGRPERTGNRLRETAPKQGPLAAILAASAKAAFLAGAFAAGVAWELAARMVKLAWKIVKPCVWPPRRILLSGIFLVNAATFMAMQPSFHGPIPREAAPSPETPGDGSREDEGSSYAATGSAQENAAVIARTGRAVGATERDIQAAIMTGLVESRLENLSGGDKTSVGLFQQKPEYWGEGGTDVATATTKFFKGINMPDGSHTPGLFDVPGREQMPLGQLCQAVQRSAYPDRYAAQEQPAKSILAGLGKNQGRKSRKAAAPEPAMPGGDAQASAALFPSEDQ